MAQDSSVKRGVFKIFALALLALFLVPLGAWLFVRYAEPHQDELYLGAIERSIDKDSRLSDPEKHSAKTFFRANPPSSTCHDRPPSRLRHTRASARWVLRQVGGSVRAAPRNITSGLLGRNTSASG